MAGAPGRSELLLRVHDLTTDPGLDDLRLTDLARRDVGEVGVHHGKISVVAFGDRAGHGAKAVDPGAARRVRGQDRRQADGLLGQEGVAALAARPGGQLPVDGDVRPHSGLGLLTGQSLPAHMAAPAASRDRNGYCQPARRSPRNGMVSSSICGSWVAQSGWMLAVADTRAKRGTSSGWITWRWAR